jgi:hypothetical protein
MKSKAASKRSFGMRAFFQRIGYAMARFMYGRNGMDHLNRALLIVYLVLYFAGTLIAGILKSDVLASVINVAVNVLMVVILFRMFSRNLYKRRAENQKWVNWWWRVKSNNAGAKARHADKDHKYFTCKQCKTICRVPVGKGKIIITCPKCKAQIQAKT